MGNCIQHGRGGEGAAWKGRWTVFKGGVHRQAVMLEGGREPSALPNGQNLEGCTSNWIMCKANSCKHKPMTGGRSYRSTMTHPDILYLWYTSLNPATDYSISPELWNRPHYVVESVHLPDEKRTCLCICVHALLHDCRIQFSGMSCFQAGTYHDLCGGDRQPINSCQGNDDHCAELSTVATGWCHDNQIHS